MRRKNKQQPGQPAKSKYDYWTPLVAVLILGAIAYWALEIRKPSSYDVCLQGFNHTARGISRYSVNGEWGGNISRKEPDGLWGGGGGFSCGITLSGKTATVKWQFPLQTREQLNQGIEVPPETHEVTVPMPEAQSNHSRYFQVHIFPDNHVELMLNDDLHTAEQNIELRKRVQAMQQEYQQRNKDNSHE